MDKAIFHCECGNCVDYESSYFCEGVVNPDDQVIKGSENMIFDIVISAITKLFFKREG